ncbi:MAG: hypothetical protein LBV41_02395 [Cytophagaceae bacterium]|jgi:hypothetical protein|nr:hypothetical protein [Cytophagaceae bacterium]
MKVLLSKQVGFRVMETDTSSKNGASTKSQTSSINKLMSGKGDRLFIFNKMRKILLFCIVALLFSSCNNKSDVNENYLIDNMLAIESSLKSGDYELFNDISSSKKYEFYFNELSRINNTMMNPNIEDEGTIRKSTNSLEELELNIEDYPFLIQAFENYPYYEGYSFSQNEQIIFQSYLNSFHTTELHPVIITQYYMEQIKMLDIDIIAQEHSVAALEFFNDLFLFLSANNEMKAEVGTPTTPVKDFELCYEKCLNYKLDQAFSGNWIDDAWWVVNAPYNFGIMMISCTASCLGTTTGHVWDGQHISNYIPSY